MMAREASSMCVSGKIPATHLTHGGEPSSENQIPDSNIMGQVSRFRRPPTSSSLENRAAMVRPSATIDKAPSSATSSNSARLPALWKWMIVDSHVQHGRHEQDQGQARHDLRGEKFECRQGRGVQALEK